MADKVKVTALEPHTAFGEAYEPGDTYDAPVDIVDSLVQQGKAAPADPAALAKRKAAPAKATLAKKSGRKARRR